MKSRVLVGRNVLRIRLEQNLSQEDLAGLAQIDRRHIGRIENRRANLTLDVLDSLAAALAVDVRDLFTPTKTGARPKPLKKGPKGPRG